MANHRVRPLGRATGALILATASVLIPVGAASPAPMPQATSLTTQVEQDRRLDNGQFIRAGSRIGRGELTIDNGSNRDAVITLATNMSPTFAVYVRNGSKYTVKGIRDGTYEIFYTTGSDWDSQNRTFTRDRNFKRFDDTLKFATTQTATETRWSTWTATLHPVIGGTANASEVNPNDFPAL